MDKKKDMKEIPSDVVEIWQRIVDSIAGILSVPSVMVNRLDPPTLEVFRSNIDKSNPLPSGTTMPLAGVYCETTAKSGKKLKVEDALKDPQWANSPTAKEGIISYLGYPLFWPNGDVFGTLCAIDTKENKWGEEYEGLFRTFRDAIQAHLALIEVSDRLTQKNAELEAALKEVKVLEGLLPICSFCKKVRDDKGYWDRIEHYIGQRSGAEFTHSICPECDKKLAEENKE